MMLIFILAIWLPATLVVVQGARFTNPSYSGVTAGDPFIITWEPASAVVTVKLNTGSSTVQRLVNTIVCKQMHNISCSGVLNWFLNVYSWCYWRKLHLDTSLRRSTRTAVRSRNRWGQFTQLLSSIYYRGTSCLRVYRKINFHRPYTFFNNCSFRYDDSLASFDQYT